MKIKGLFTLTALALLIFPATNFAITPVENNISSIESATVLTSKSSAREFGDVDEFATRISMGIKGGVNLSNIYDSQSNDFQYDSKLGFAAGVFIAIPIGTYFGIQPELLFSQKGVKGTGSVLVSDYTFTRTTNYLDVPLLIAVKPLNEVTVLFGPQFSYLLNQTNSFNSDFGNVNIKDEYDNDNLRKNTLCFTGGFDINLSNFVIGTRIGWDLMDNKGDGTSSTPRYKNMWTQATIGFRF